MQSLDISVAGCVVRCDIKNSTLFQSAVSRYKNFIHNSTKKLAPPVLKINTNSIYAFENILRQHFAKTLIQKGGFLIHSTGIRKKDKATLFSGVSGAGKSTIAKIFNRNDILSDEIVAIKKSKSGKYLAYATPFWGEMRYVPDSIDKNPPCCLKNLYFLEKSHLLRIITISHTTAIKKILRNVIVFPKQNNFQLLSERLLSIIIDFSRKIRIKKLLFNLENLNKIKKLL